jgi:hypothetical protein
VTSKQAPDILSHNVDDWPIEFAAGRNRNEWLSRQIQNDMPVSAAGSFGPGDLVPSEFGRDRVAFDTAAHEIPPSGLLRGSCRAAP